MTVSEVARLLNLTPQTVRCFIADGRLVAQVVGRPRSPNGRRYRVKLADVLRLLSPPTTEMTPSD
jgi:excisionase family DNA binding protein